MIPYLVYVFGYFFVPFQNSLVLRKLISKGRVKKTNMVHTVKLKSSLNFVAMCIFHIRQSGVSSWNFNYLTGFFSNKRQRKNLVKLSCDNIWDVSILMVFQKFLCCIVLKSSKTFFSQENSFTFLEANHSQNCGIPL